ncbi:hypothetical protein [Acetobacter fabarum]|jgi:hypothetical protein|uniref:hypothetical protein n=1 Tax=Acetobacter fabarum TaxID=483199 RepID=UPI00117899CF|nr:hypothetical protein [Acetobacter fabarum]
MNYYSVLRGDRADVCKALEKGGIKKGLVKKKANSPCFVTIKSSSYLDVVHAVNICKMFGLLEIAPIMPTPI